MIDVIAFSYPFIISTKVNRGPPPIVGSEPSGEELGGEYYILERSEILVLANSSKAARIPRDSVYNGRVVAVPSSVGNIATVELKNLDAFRKISLEEVKRLYVPWAKCVRGCFAVSDGKVMKKIGCEEGTFATTISAIRRFE